MTIAQRRIAFINKTRSDRWIARESGISRTTIGYVRRGERTFSTQQKAALRNVYQREAYGRMTATGFSATQARRYSWYAPESIGLKISEMKLLVDRFTIGAVGMEVAKAQRAGISYDIDLLWLDMKQKIIKGLQDSREPVEEFAEPDY